MEKRIFEEQIAQEEQVYQAKREFEAQAIVIEEEQEKHDDFSIEQTLKPSRIKVRLLLLCLLLLAGAVIAQSVQWLINTWQTNQWIYFVFAIVFLGGSLVGIGIIIAEWRKLIWLRKHYQRQQQSQQFLLTQESSGKEATQFCKHILAHLTQNPYVKQAEQRWLSQLDEAYNGQEVLFLFGQNVLAPIDAQVKKLISKNALENAVIVSISPLAIVDILMMAWRNIALVNKITRAYGMELGYISRLKLFKMVLTNMVFAGATEIATDLGSEFFAQNLTAKLSMRAAQGIGVGLLTARLGIKAMEFCRPVIFVENERPKLSVVKQELLSTLKNQMFSKSKETESERI